MNKYLLLAVVSTITFLTACNLAVHSPELASYTVTGDAQSAIYPLNVKQHSEDVLIELKDRSPIPEIFSFDENGKEIIFQFTIEGNVLIVPAKFTHLKLTHTGDTSIDIFKKNTN